MDDETLGALTGAGLGELEARAYIALVEEGPASASEVAREAGIYRTNAYDALDGLVKKGLASFVVKEGRKYYAAAAPERIRNFFEEKETTLKGKIDSAVDGLEKKFGRCREAEAVYISKGRQAVHSTTRDAIKAIGEGGEWLHINPGQPILMRMSPVFFETFKKLMNAKKITYKVIYTGLEEWGRKEEKVMRGFVRYDPRYLPQKTPAMAGFHVCGDLVILRIYDKDQTIISIESPAVAKAFKHYFYQLWRLAKR